VSLVDLLFKWNYEDIGEKRILEYVSIKDKGHLRETCVEMGWTGLHKEAFHVSLTPERLQDMRLQGYPRLYPHIKMPIVLAWLFSQFLRMPWWEMHTIWKE
jgi:hypothetical protein